MKVTRTQIHTQYMHGELLTMDLGDIRYGVEILRVDGVRYESFRSKDGKQIGGGVDGTKAECKVDAMEYFRGLLW
jgi:hypothetical protein